MAWIDRYGDLYYSYYVCDNCGLKVPAQQIDKAVPVFTEGKEGQPRGEVGVVTLPARVLCQCVEGGNEMRRETPVKPPQTADRKGPARVRGS